MQDGCLRLRADIAGVIQIDAVLRTVLLHVILKALHDAGVLLPFRAARAEHHAAEHRNMAEDQLGHCPPDDLVVRLYAAQRCRLRVAETHLHHCHTAVADMLPLLPAQCFQMAHRQQAVQFVFCQQGAHLLHRAGGSRVNFIRKAEFPALHVQVFRAFQIVPHALPQRRVIEAVVAALIWQQHSDVLGSAL